MIIKMNPNEINISGTSFAQTTNDKTETIISSSAFNPLSFWLRANSCNHVLVYLFKHIQNYSSF